MLMEIRKAKFKPEVCFAWSGAPRCRPVRQRPPNATKLQMQQIIYKQEKDTTNHHLSSNTIIYMTFALDSCLTAHPALAVDWEYNQW